MKINEYKGKTVLVVAHGRVVRAFLSILLGTPVAEIFKIKFLNTSVTTLELIDDKFEKRDYNCIKHLEFEE